MIDRLFAYGTLELRVLMAELTGRLPRSEHAVLAGFRRGRLSGRPYPGLAVDPSGCVDGTLYIGLSRRELAQLDRYEGTEYRRMLLDLRTRRRSCKAWVYVQRSGIPLDGAWESAARRQESGSGGLTTG